jgi:hypothetical protein
MTDTSRERADQSETRGANINSVISRQPASDVNSMISRQPASDDSRVITFSSRVESTSARATDNVSHASSVAEKKRTFCSTTDGENPDQRVCNENRRLEAYLPHLRETGPPNHTVPSAVHSVGLVQVLPSQHPVTLMSTRISMTAGSSDEDRGLCNERSCNGTCHRVDDPGVQQGNNDSIVLIFGSSPNHLK